jgi:hypothetical protein
MKAYDMNFDIIIMIYGYDWDMSRIQMIMIVTVQNMSS